MNLKTNEVSISWRRITRSRPRLGSIWRMVIFLPSPISPTIGQERGYLMVLDFSHVSTRLHVKRIMSEVCLGEDNCREAPRSAYSTIPYLCGSHAESSSSRQDEALFLGSRIRNLFWLQSFMSRPLDFALASKIMKVVPSRRQVSIP